MGTSYLPYADTALEDQALRGRVERLVRAECRRRLDAAPFDAEAFLAQRGRPLLCKLSEGDEDGSGAGFLRAEFDRVQQRTPSSSATDGEQASQHPLPSDDPRYAPVPAPNAGASVAQWRTAIEHNQIVLERMDTDLTNAELQLEYGQSSWKVLAQTIETLELRAAAGLTATNRRVHGINQQRKAAHLATLNSETEQRTAWLDHILHVRSIRQRLRDAASAKRARVDG